MERRPESVPAAVMALLKEQRALLLELYDAVQTFDEDLLRLSAGKALDAVARLNFAMNNWFVAEDALPDQRAGSDGAEGGGGREGEDDLDGDYEDDEEDYEDDDDDEDYYDEDDDVEGLDGYDDEEDDRDGEEDDEEGC